MISQQIDLSKLIEETSFVCSYCKPSHLSRGGELELLDDKEDDKIVSEPRPIVSIAVLAYNSEKYIEENVRGILMQKLDVPYEIVISDDCAADATRKICQELKQLYPTIRILHPASNMGVSKNFMFLLSACRGDYIACIDGDDFYSSPNKIQMQVDYLMRHPEASMVWCGIDVQLEKNVWTRTHYSRNSRALRCSTNFLSSAEWRRMCVLSDPVCTITPLMRRSCVLHVIERMKDLLEECRWLPVQDIEAWFFAAEIGKVHYIDSSMGVYRLNQSSHMAAVDPFKMMLNIVGSHRIKLALIERAHKAFSDDDVCEVIVEMICNVAKFVSVAGECFKDFPFPYIKEMFVRYNRYVPEKIRNSIYTGSFSTLEVELRNEILKSKWHRSWLYLGMKKIAINYLGM